MIGFTLNKNDVLEYERSIKLDCNLSTKTYFQTEIINNKKLKKKIKDKKYTPIEISIFERKILNDFRIEFSKTNNIHYFSSIFTYLYSLK